MTASFSHSTRLQGADESVRYSDKLIDLLRETFHTARLDGGWTETVLRAEGVNAAEIDPHVLMDLIYAEWLLTRDTRSSSSLYSRLIDDIRNDIVRIPAFLEIARKVTDLDSKREKSMAYVSVLSPEEVFDARRRIAENRLVIGWVFRSLNDRAAAYHFAMERLVIHVPQHYAVEVERQWTLLKTRIALLNIAPPAPIAAVVTK